MFFSFFNSNSKTKELEARIKALEDRNEVLALTLQAIQAQLSVAAQSTLLLKGDVKEIQDAINSFVEHALANEMLYNMKTTDGYEH